MYGRSRGREPGGAPNTGPERSPQPLDPLLLAGFIMGSVRAKRTTGGRSSVARTAGPRAIASTVVKAREWKGTVRQSSIPEKRRNLFQANLLQKTKWVRSVGSAPRPGRFPRRRDGGGGSRIARGGVGGSGRCSAPVRLREGGRRQGRHSGPSLIGSRNDGVLVTESGRGDADVPSLLGAERPGGREVAGAWIGTSGSGRGDQESRVDSRGAREYCSPRLWGVECGPENPGPADAPPEIRSTTRSASMPRVGHSPP